jgi:hypothetical protein
LLIVQFRLVFNAIRWNLNGRALCFPMSRRK